MPECKICSKRHSGPCNKANLVCFKCNGKGHYASECRNAKVGVTCFKCGKAGYISRECKSGGSNDKIIDKWHFIPLRTFYNDLDWCLELKYFIFLTCFGVFLHFRV